MRLKHYAKKLTLSLGILSVFILILIIYQVWAEIGHQTALASPNPLLNVRAGAPPILDLNGPDVGLDYEATFIQGGGPVAIVDSANLTIGDTDSTLLNSATITITNLLDGVAEIVAADTIGTAIGSNYNNLTGALSLTGTDTITNYQQVLRTVTYDNTAINPDLTARLIAFVVNDGMESSETVSTTLNFVQPQTIYLPVVLKRFAAVPIPPTISNLRSNVLGEINTCEFISGPPGTEFEILFDYSDPNGNIADPPNPIIFITFLPANDTVELEKGEFYTYIDGDGFEGRVGIDEFCIRFGNQTSVRITASLKDSTELESNVLTLDVPRPPGTNMSDDTTMPAVAPKK